MAAFGIGFPFDISGSPKIGGDAGPALSSATQGPVQVGGLNAPPYPFAGIPRPQGNSISPVGDRELLLLLGLGALVLLARRR